jgi:hypothetical protein
MPVIKNCRAIILWSWLNTYLVQNDCLCPACSSPLCIVSIAAMPAWCTSSLLAMIAYLKDYFGKIPDEQVGFMELFSEIL